jgi:adenylosuccinate lyase
MTAPLLALSPLDGRYAEKLTSLRQHLSEYALNKRRVLVEIEWLLFLSECEAILEFPTLELAQRDKLRNLVDQFDLEAALKVKQLEASTNHDVKAVEYYLQDKFKQDSSLTLLIPWIHFACTSEDINNLAYALMMKDTHEQLLLPLLTELRQQIYSKAMDYANLAMLARTHGQSATPTTLGKELANFVARLDRQLQTLKQQVFLGKFNGAVGNYNAHAIAYPLVEWPELAQRFVKSLGLGFNPMTTQIEPHDYIAEWLQQITRINSILLDLSRDCWGYISLGYFKQARKAQEIGSSTMPHKINPIDFENAEGNLGLAQALNEHLALKLPISRWQRDLSDSTCLRNLGVALGYSLLSYQSLKQGLGKISADENKIAQELNERWELLAEPIQTVMRRYGITDAYEQLKTLTRGELIDHNIIKSFIENLALPKVAKEQLLSLTPSLYLGFAVSLTKQLD